jgi:molecular chaperone GrpE
MVNEHDKKDDDFEVTNDTDHGHDEEVELTDIEESSGGKLKAMRQKLMAAEEAKRDSLEELQRTKADFLNARKRLEEERILDRTRAKKQFIEDILPLCDSFTMAMSNTEAWEKADKAWRTGVEGIYGQLQRILESYGITTVNPLGEAFDPYRHDAIGTKVVTDKKQQDTVVAVLQYGYELKNGDKTDIIRPARVTTGSYEEKS